MLHPEPPLHARLQSPRHVTLQLAPLSQVTVAPRPTVMVHDAPLSHRALQPRSQLPLHEAPSSQRKWQAPVHSLGWRQHEAPLFAHEQCEGSLHVGGVPEQMLVATATSLLHDPHAAAPRQTGTPGGQLADVAHG
jgi:hypothetical protein